MTAKNPSVHVGSYAYSDRALQAPILGHFTLNDVPIAVGTSATLVSPESLCPDLLRWEQLGPADDLRGHVIRMFMRLMDAWPVTHSPKPRGDRR